MFWHIFNTFLVFVVLSIFLILLTAKEDEEFTTAGKFVSSSIVDAGFSTKSLVTTSTGTYVVKGGFSGEYGNEVKIKKVVREYTFFTPSERIYICTTLSKINKDYCRMIVD